MHAYQFQTGSQNATRHFSSPSCPAARDVQVSIGGSGAAEVWARDALTISIGGSGEVSYYGDPRISRSMQRSSSIKRLGAAPN